LVDGLKWVASGALMAIVAGHPAFGQAIERHAPQVPVGNTQPLALPNLVPDNADVTPIGPELRGIALLDKDEPVQAGAQAGISIEHLARLVPETARLTQDLTPFLGQKLSRHAIAQIEAVLARRYRALNYPFVAFFTPEQDISTGILQIRVVEFRVGEVKASGASPARSARLVDASGLRHGDAINTASLANTLGWMNRYPFAGVQAVFSPAATQGETDLTLVSMASKPWQVYAGYDNSGSPSTGRDRIYAGLSVGGLLGHESVLGYQATGSTDLFGHFAHPEYFSNSLSYRLPVTRTSQVEVALDSVQTNQSGTPFSVRLNIDEANIDWRFGVGALAFGGETDLRIGGSAKTQKGTTLFGAITAYVARVEDYQVVAGLHHNQPDRFGATDADLVVHYSPGNLDPLNSDAQVLLYSQGRQSDASYVYLTLALDRQTAIGPLVWHSAFSGQWANQPLSRSEQAGVGGNNLVRGYSLDDGAFDEAVVWRNELGPKAVPMGANSTMSPFIFADWGAGRDLFTHTSQDLGSAGFGANFTLAKYAALRLESVHTLKATPTLPITNRIQVSFSARY
jgi:hemolysin activation/secretion protein